MPDPTNQNPANGNTNLPNGQALPAFMALGKPDAAQNTPKETANFSFFITPPKKPSKILNKKTIIPTILGLLLLVGGLTAGIILVQQRQEIREKAGLVNYAKCTGVKALDQQGNELSPTQLSNLKPGDTVRFIAYGSTDSGTFDMGKIEINGTLLDAKFVPEDLTFYYDYVVPSDTTSFTVKAYIHHTLYGWIPNLPG